MYFTLVALACVVVLVTPHKYKEQEYVFDVQFPSIHKCKDGGEVYSGAYLITKSHLLEENLTPISLRKRISCETASFMIMRSKANPKRDIIGAPVQTLDVFDFSVIHLSAYERLERFFTHRRSRAFLPNITAVVPIKKILPTTNTFLFHQEYTQYFASLQLSELSRTLAVMPILIDSMGFGHSEPSNRILYLQTCFFSLETVFPNIVVFVASEHERSFLLNTVSLAFYDVVVVDTYNRSDALPAAAVVETQRRFKSREWDFDFLYYTESDQILLLRKPQVLFDYLKKYPHRVAVPHRLMAYPSVIARQVFHKQVSGEGPFAWLNMSCFMPRTNCMGDRSDWVHVSHPSVSAVTLLNLIVPLGNSNFLTQMFRACALQAQT